MKIANAEKQGLFRQYHIIVDAQEIDTQQQNQLKSIGQKAKIPGFRPGKIPMSVLKQRYGKDIMDEVLWNCVNAATRQIVEEQNVRPALKPDVQIKNFSDGGDLEFELSFDIMPDAPALDYESITISEYQFEVPESEIQHGLERLAQSRKHYHSAKADHQAETGDAVKIDFLGKLEGTPFDGGKGEGFQLELGSGQFIPGFEEQLIGKKAGDKTIVKVKFPEQYHSEALKGKDAEFDVTVHEVLTPHVPDINDQFAKDLGFDDLEAIKAAVREQIQNDYADLARNKAKKELFDYLDEHIKFDVPEKMKEMEFEGVWQQLQQAKSQGDASLQNKSEEELREEYQAVAERRVRLGILLAEIGREHNVQVSKDELTRAVMQQAQMFPGQERKVFEFYQQNPEHVDELRGPIIEDKAVDVILSKVKRDTKSVSLEALMQDEAATDMAKAKPKKKSASKKADTKSDESSTEKKKSAAKKPAAKKKS